MGFVFAKSRSCWEETGGNQSDSELYLIGFMYGTYILYIYLHEWLSFMVDIGS